MGTKSIFTSRNLLCLSEVMHANLFSLVPDIYQTSNYLAIIITNPKAEKIYSKDIKVFYVLLHKYCLGSDIVTGVWEKVVSNTDRIPVFLEFMY